MAIKNSVRKGRRKVDLARGAILARAGPVSKLN